MAEFTSVGQVLEAEKNCGGPECYWTKHATIDQFKLFSVNSKLRTELLGHIEQLNRLAGTSYGYKIIRYLYLRTSTVHSLFLDRLDVHLDAGDMKRAVNVVYNLWPEPDIWFDELKMDMAAVSVCDQRTIRKSVSSPVSALLRTVLGQPVFTMFCGTAQQFMFELACYPRLVRYFTLLLDGGGRFTERELACCRVWTSPFKLASAHAEKLCAWHSLLRPLYTTLTLYNRYVRDNPLLRLIDKLYIISTDHYQLYRDVFGDNRTIVVAGAGKPNEQWVSHDRNPVNFDAETAIDPSLSSCHQQYNKSCKEATSDDVATAKITVSGIVTNLRPRFLRQTTSSIASCIDYLQTQLTQAFGVNVAIGTASIPTSCSTIHGVPLTADIAQLAPRFRFFLTQPYIPDMFMGALNTQTDSMIELELILARIDQHKKRRVNVPEKWTNAGTDSYLQFQSLGSEILAKQQTHRAHITTGRLLCFPYSIVKYNVGTGRSAQPHPVLSDSTLADYILAVRLPRSLDYVTRSTTASAPHDENSGQMFVDDAGYCFRPVMFLPKFRSRTEREATTEFQYVMFRSTCAYGIDPVLTGDPQYWILYGVCSVDLADGHHTLDVVTRSIYDDDSSKGKNVVTADHSRLEIVVSDFYTNTTIPKYRIYSILSTVLADPILSTIKYNTMARNAECLYGLRRQHVGVPYKVINWQFGNKLPVSVIAVTESTTMFKGESTDVCPPTHVLAVHLRNEYETPARNEYETTTRNEYETPARNECETTTRNERETTALAPQQQPPPSLEADTGGEFKFGSEAIESSRTDRDTAFEYALFPVATESTSSLQHSCQSRRSCHFRNHTSVVFTVHSFDALNLTIHPIDPINTFRDVPISFDCHLRAKSWRNVYNMLIWPSNPHSVAGLDQLFAHCDFRYIRVNFTRTRNLLIAHPISSAEPNQTIPDQCIKSTRQRQQRTRLLPPSVVCSCLSHSYRIYSVIHVNNGPPADELNCRRAGTTKRWQFRDGLISASTLHLLPATGVGVLLNPYSGCELFDSDVISS